MKKKACLTANKEFNLFNQFEQEKAVLYLHVKKLAKLLL